ncbi:MAG: methyltransferase domain-containing protein [Chloroflexi bacterium]|nr:MAG: methyltransferase domain-containing protein [Chloroflexota bacterium]
MSQNITHKKNVVRSKEATKAGYDGLSKWYDAITGSYLRKSRERGLQKLNVDEGETVLEIGFGTGHGIIAMANSVGNAGKVYGLDISEGMRSVAQNRIAKAGLSHRVKLNVGDAAKLPFEDNFFDAIFTSFTLELLETHELPIVLLQCQRVLKAGGRIGVVSLSKKTEGNKIMTSLYRLAYRYYPDLAGHPHLIQKALEEAGFHTLDATQLSVWGLPVEIILAQKP